MSKNYKYFSKLTSTTASVTTASVAILTTNSDRSYVLIQNNTSADVWISFSSPAKLDFGIKLAAYGGAFEMSGQYGNLYDGSIYAILDAQAAKIIQVNEGSGV